MKEYIKVASWRSQALQLCVTDAADTWRIIYFKLSKIICIVFCVLMMAFSSGSKIGADNNKIGEWGGGGGGGGNHQNTNKKETIKEKRKIKKSKNLIFLFNRVSCIERGYHTHSLLCVICINKSLKQLGIPQQN